MSAKTAPLRVDIVSDVVCPWCVIGYHQLAAASDRSGVPLDIHWHPFELNPDVAPEGENLRAHLAAKYGTTPEGSRQARARLTALGAELGFSFNYADDMRMMNSFRAHQLIHWAEGQGRGHEMKLALFGAFFTHRRDIFDPKILAAAAAEIGLDREGALAILEEGRYGEAVREAERSWLARGIQGVPAVILEQRHLLSGAQGVERYAAALKQNAAQRAA